MCTKADSRVSQSRMTIISTFSVGMSNATHFEPNWSSTRRIGGGGLSIAEFNQVNLYHDCCRHGRYPDQLTGYVASTNRWTTRNSLVFAGRFDGAVRSGNRIGSNRLRVDWISNQHCDRVDARKRNRYQPICQKKSPGTLSLSVSPQNPSVSLSHDAPNLPNHRHEKVRIRLTVLGALLHDNVCTGKPLSHGHRRHYGIRGNH